MEVVHQHTSNAPPLLPPACLPLPPDVPGCTGVQCPAHSHCVAVDPVNPACSWSLSSPDTYSNGEGGRQPGRRPLCSWPLCMGRTGPCNTASVAELKECCFRRALTCRLPVKTLRRNQLAPDQPQAAHALPLRSSIHLRVALWRGTQSIRRLPQRWDPRHV